MEIGFPARTPAPAVIIAHGLRSYFTGFLDTFAKRLRQAGYITVKFHFLGTGKSSGRFEDKTTKEMLRNYEDVLDFVAARKDVTGIGVVGRSNAGTLAAIHGPDQRIKAYSLLAPSFYFATAMKKFVENSKKVGKYFYHRSYKRPHTKGPGRLPLSFIREIKKFEPRLAPNIPKMKRVIIFQSTKDEAIPMSEGHFDYWKSHLPEPKKAVVIHGGNHSYKGHKKAVIEESVRWFKKYL